MSAAALPAAAVVTALQSAAWGASRGQAQGPASSPSFIAGSPDAPEGVSETREHTWLAPHPHPCPVFSFRAQCVYFTGGAGPTLERIATWSFPWMYP